MLLSMREKQATCKYAVYDGGLEPLCDTMWNYGKVCRGCDQYDPKEEEKHCYDCKFEPVCIMSAPDGRWKACNKYEPNEKDNV